MAKSEYLKKVINHDVSLKDALEHLLILSNEIKLDNSIIQFANNELFGYHDKDQLPDYRYLNMGRIIYSGFNGYCKITNCPLPYDFHDEPEIYEALNKQMIPFSIVELTNIIESNQPTGINIFELSGIVEKYTGIICTELRMDYTKAVYENILGKTRLKAIDIYYSLDKKYGKVIDNLYFESYNENKNNVLTLNANNLSIKNSNIGNKNQVEKKLSPSLSINNDFKFPKFNLLQKLKTFFHINI